MMKLGGFSILLAVSGLVNLAYVAWDARKFDARVNDMMRIYEKITPFVGLEPQLLGDIDAGWLRWIAEKGGDECTGFAESLLGCLRGQIVLRTSDLPPSMRIDAMRAEIIGQRRIWSVVIIAFATLVWSVRWAHAGMREVLWRARGCCTRCGYDLTGNITGVCSECGTAFEARTSKEQEDSGQPHVA